MDRLYPGAWSGLQKKQVVERVRKCRAKLGFGNIITTITDTPQYRLMTDCERPFLQAFGTYPHPEDPKEYMRMMIFANPSLLSLLKTPQLDMYVDATFDCAPRPFYQCLIVMVYNHETSSYVPVLYSLMSHKNKALYWHVFQGIIYCSGWEIKAKTYTTDFERALLNQMAIQFGGDGGGVHVGCFFHLKQAWRKYLLEKCKFSYDEIKDAMKVGALDMLCIIPRDEIEKYGIPFLRSKFEDGADHDSVEKWDIFWKYFGKQWLPIVESWNIIDENGETLEIRNHTNNAIESYNRRFNGLFTSKPSLIVFVQIVEEESRKQFTRLDEIRTGKARPSELLEVSIPSVNEGYAPFKARLNKKKKEASRKKSAKK